jgi:hypothetical protein
MMMKTTRRTAGERRQRGNQLRTIRETNSVVKGKNKKIITV